MQIDDRWVDVDFTKEPQYVPGDNTRPEDLEVFGRYADDFTILTWAEIDEAIEGIEETATGLEQLASRVYDQGREGSCVANANGQACELIQAVEYGIDEVVHLSAISLYKRIGRSPSSGATISDGWREIHERGILPLDNEENLDRGYGTRMPNTGFRNPFPPNWQDSAKYFRIREGHVCKSERELLSALCLRMPVVVGREGHSICYTTPLRGRKAGYINSWKNWGAAFGTQDHGFGIDSMSQMRKSARWAVAFRGMYGPLPHLEARS